MCARTKRKKTKNSNHIGLAACFRGTREVKSYRRWNCIKSSVLLLLLLSLFSSSVLTGSKKLQFTAAKIATISNASEPNFALSNESRNGRKNAFPVIKSTDTQGNEKIVEWIFFNYGIIRKLNLARSSFCAKLFQSKLLKNVQLTPPVND